MLELITVAGQLDLFIALSLILLAGFTSFMTATLGIGGGLLLLAVMSTIVPANVLIPVHGLVQLGSNGNRAVMTWKHTDFSMVKWFSLGAILAASVSFFIVIQLPIAVIQVAMGGFILFLLWGAKPKKRELSKYGQSFAGFLTTILTMFVGATGPLVAAYVHRNGYQKMQVMATFANCMVVQNMLKAIVFIAVGFAFTAWLPLVVLMVISGTIGTWIGLKLLNKIPAAQFQLIFKVVVSILAIRLLTMGLISLFSAG